MADEQAPTQSPAASAPKPAQVQPQAADVVKPPATAAQARPDAPADNEDPRSKAARLRREAAEIEATLTADEGHTRVKVEAPHIQFEFGGTLIGDEFVPVHNTKLADIQEAADAAGVTLTIE